MEISIIQKEFNRRFCEAVYHLINTGAIESLRRLVMDCGLTYQRYTEFDRDFGQNKKASRYKTVEIEIIHKLATTYKVNINWLVTGRGSMIL